MEARGEGGGSGRVGGQQVARPACGDRREDRQPEGGAEPLGGVEEAGGQAGSLGRHTRVGRRRHPHEHGAQSQGHVSGPGRRRTKTDEKELLAIARGKID